MTATKSAVGTGLHSTMRGRVWPAATMRAMHKRLTQEGFDRRYVLAPLLLSIALVILGFCLTEMRRAQMRQLDDDLRMRQDIIRLIGDAMEGSQQAQGALRGFLLTGEEQHLAPMEAGLSDAHRNLDALAPLYRQLDPPELARLESAQAELVARTQEMQQSVALYEEGQAVRAQQLATSGPGLHRMSVFFQSLDALRTQQRHRVSSAMSAWDSSMRVNTIIGLGSMLFSIALLVVLGLLVTRDIRRRDSFATSLATQIDARTAELRDLSRHMSRVAEAEKHALARELHDELGGLLVVMRMDISQIRKRLAGVGEPELKPHWERVEQALAAGLELKRRVIEELRPTLLDNMGLFTALRWLASQRAEQAQLELEMCGLEEDVELPADAAIAVFRAVQEAISNTVKHSGATQMAVDAEVDGGWLTVRISDNGCGIPPDAEQRGSAHGLKRMRFWMESVGGTLNFHRREPAGTTVELSRPLEERGAT